MSNDFKPMKVREKELDRLKTVQDEIGNSGWYRSRNTVSLSECVGYLMDIREELKRQGYSIEWHPDKIPEYRISLTMQDGESK